MDFVRAHSAFIRQKICPASMLIGGIGGGLVEMSLEQVNLEMLHISKLFWNRAAERGCGAL